MKHFQMFFFCKYVLEMLGVHQRNWGLYKVDIMGSNHQTDLTWGVIIIENMNRQASL